MTYEVWHDLVDSSTGCAFMTWCAWSSVVRRSFSPAGRRSPIPPESAWRCRGRAHFSLRRLPSPRWLTTAHTNRRPVQTLQCRYREPDATALRTATEQRFAAVERYVVFSDLHVERSRLHTCLEVLRTVHDCAVNLDAGIVFLGDFWHTRGSLPVPCLNGVIDVMKTFTRPTVMIPGNHDQVSLGGLEHALTPIAAAMPAGLVKVIDRPQVFLNALWLPYRRDTTEVLQALREHGPHVRAVFCHAEILGALLNSNAWVSALDGLDPAVFPAAPIPTYSGHYHRPHAVPHHAHIVYCGSPYQVTLAEERQQKRLLVLDTASWRVQQQVPLDVGTRYFRVHLSTVLTSMSSSTEAMDRGVLRIEQEPVRPGDVLVIEYATGDHATEAAERASEWLRAHGLRVRWQERRPDDGASERPQRHVPRIEDAEQLDPRQILRLYAEQRPSELSAAAVDCGVALLTELASAPTTPNAASASQQVRVAFQRVRLRNFGSFAEPIAAVARAQTEADAEESAPTTGPDEPPTDAHTTVYPLARRGIVFLTGRNLDEDGFESNAAGKTTLAMSALWALTGQMEPRHRARRNTAQLRILNQNAQQGYVELEALVNERPLRVRREVHRRGRARDRLEQRLRVWYAEQELTCQGLEETQQRLSEIVNPALLLQTVFFGQHLTNDLLVATDKEFKDALEGVVPLAIWNEAVVRASARERGAAEDAERARRDAVDHEAAAGRERHRAQELRHNAAAAVQHLEARLQQVSAELEAMGGVDENAAATAASTAVPAENPDEAQQRVRQHEQEVRLLSEALHALGGHLAQHEQELQLAERARALHAEAAVETQRALAAFPGDLAERKTAAEASLRAAEQRVHEALQRAAHLEARQAQLNEWLHKHEQHVQSNAADDATCALCLQPVDTQAYARRLGDLQRSRQQLCTELSAAQDECTSRSAEVERLRQQRRELEQQVDRQRALLHWVNPYERSCVPDTRLEQMRQERQRAAEEQGRLRTRLEQARTQCHTAKAAQERVRLEHERQQYQRQLAQRLRQEWHQLRQQMQSALQPLQQAADQAEQHARQLEVQAAAARTHAATAQQDVALFSQLKNAFHRGGIQSFIIDQALSDIERLCARYLDALSDGALQLHVERRVREWSTSAANSDDTPTLNVHAPTVEALALCVRVLDPKSGQMRERDVPLLSGGQFRRVSLALTLAFAEFACHRTGYECNLIVLDEVLQHLDREGVRRLAAVLRMIRRDTVLVIAHEHARHVADVAHAHDLVERCDGRSQVRVSVSSAVWS
ncbi:hypothetical protein CDCA_CDCA05G1448 [Cyanidium caldarium]|uniref:Calcineurin-like phosphoesterase domain-containing protein n=1 Tax=Cyanidium caldarium TaxID=2771 RepID=A0AAV9IT27_CYACA|nr:hypothetical protein CDCA_CDCA05G1448 [Cyanidium caldarium]